MKIARKIAALILVCLLVAGAFFLGRYTAPGEYSNTFYATIDSVSGNAVAVTGLEVNDINHRGQFHFSLDEDVEITWRYAPLSAGELKAGQTIAITYTGPVLETWPAGLTKVLKIQLLDDTK